MTPVRKWGIVAFIGLLLLGFAARYIPELDQQNWHLGIKIAFILFLCCAMFAAFYDKKNFSGKTWDFNPKRGLFFFFLGLLIFPILALIKASFSTDLTWTGMITFTLIGSVIIGVLGIFTEHIGI